MFGVSKSWSAWCLIGFVSVYAVACGGEENNKTDTQADMAVVEMDMGITEGDMTAQGIPSAYEERYELRFESLKFTEETIPNKDAVIKLLNGALNMNFDQSIETPIVILMDIKNIDADAGALEIRAGAGEKTVNDEEYEWDDLTPRDYVDGTLTADTGAFVSTTPEFVFIATLGSGDSATRVPLTINDLKITATLENSDEGNDAKITEGRLEGYMTKEKGDSAMVELTPGSPVVLTTVFGEENLDFDSNGDGTNDSWALFATFDARPTSID